VHQEREAKAPGWSGGLVFPQPHGGPWRPSAAVLVVRRAQLALGLPTGMHALRHGHATVLIEAGVSVKAIAERLGHENAALVLSTYAHVTQVSRDAVLRALDAAMAPPAGINGVRSVAKSFVDPAVDQALIFTELAEEFQPVSGEAKAI
jgi:integrase